MTWLRRYRFGLYVRNSLWILPTLSIVVALVCVAVLTRIELAVGVPTSVSPETARIILSTVAASTFTLVVLVSSAMLLAIQLASAQLSPRIISMIYRTSHGKLAFSVFVFTFTFAVATLVRIEKTVPTVTGYIACYSFLINIALFIYFVDMLGKTLRPSAALRQVGMAGREVIRSVYPSLRTEDTRLPEPLRIPGHVERRVIQSAKDGALLAFDMSGLISRATKSNCVIELVPQVGDFIASGDPLFRIFGKSDALADAELCNSAAIGHERTLEQDPMFAFRIIVDIASKALSPAINDPTTAVLAIDQIHHLLRDIGKRYLAEGQEREAQGQLRLLYRTPEWEDFVQLGTTEIRQYGDESIQVQRRLRAMLEDLIETLPPHRHAVLQKELALLGSSSKRAFPDLADQMLAESGDLQGIGGSDDDDDVYEDNQAAVPRRIS
jgi:uncharacterized membrane protein